MKKEMKNSLFLFWLCAVLLYFIANLQKVVMPGAIFNELQEHFSATAGSVTGIGAMFMYTYAVSQLVVGLLVDRYSGARMQRYTFSII
jgi:sugar phosphate permease